MKTSLKSTITLLAILLIEIGAVSSQNSIGAYNRSSISYSFINPETPLDKEICFMLSNMAIPEKYDDHRIEPDFIKADHSNIKRPSPLNPGDDLNDLINRDAVRSYQDAMRIYTDSVSPIVVENLDAVVRAVVAKWFDRDSEGKFGLSFVQQRGEYNAKDMDLKTAAGQQRGYAIIKDAGFNLLSNTYIVVYEVLVTTVNKDVVKKNISDGKEQKVHINGYSAEYTAFMYKLNFSDSIASLFWENYWVDNENFDQSKVTAFDLAKFPVEYISSFSHVASSTQNTYESPTEVQKHLVMKSDLQLKQDLAQEIHDKTLSNLFEKSDMFDVKTSLFAIDPLQSKIGLKEGVYTDKRFYVYEIKQKKNSNELIKVRQGAIRASTNVTSNLSITTGNTTPSEFYQICGKKLEVGMLVEEKKDIGLSLVGGYTYSLYDEIGMGDRFSQGASFAAKYNVSKLIASLKDDGSVKHPGIYAGVEFTLGGGQDNRTGFIYTDSASLSNQGNEYNYSIANVVFTLSREYYSKRRGGLVFSPSLGYGYSWLTLVRENGVSLGNGFIRNENPFSWKAKVFNIGTSFGLNITPLLTLFVKPQITVRAPYYTNTESKLPLMQTYYDVEELDPVKDNGFETIDKFSTGSNILIGLKINI